MAHDEAVIYCRASKDKTGAGISVAGQESDGRRFAAERGLTVREVYADNDISADGRKPRPGYRRMLADLASKPAVVIVWHTDRLHRHLSELEEYIALAEARGITTCAVRAGDIDLATPTGRMFARQLAVYARFELEHMSERRRAGKARAAAAGRWKGGRRPFGYARDGVTVVPEEAALVASGSEAILAGSSLTSVVRSWNAAGIPTSTGRPWMATEVHRVLCRPRNAGLMEHQGQVLEGVKAEWPAIVDESVWRGVVAALSDPSRRTTPGPGRQWLLSGIAKCGICGRGLIVSKVTGRGRKPRPVYRCRPERGSGAFGHLARDTGSLDEYVTEAVLARLARPDAADLTRPAEGDGDGSLPIQALALRQRLDQAADMFAAQQIDAGQFTRATARLNADLAQVNHKLAELSRNASLVAFAGRDPGVVWAGLDLARRRAAVTVLLEVIVHPAPRGRRPGWQPGESYFDAKSVELKWRQ